MSVDASRKNHRRGLRAFIKKVMEPVDIMVIRRFGRVFRINLSGGTLVLALAFFLAFFSASIWLINQYVFLYLAHEKLNAQFEKTNRALDELRYQADVVQRYGELVKQFEEAEKRKNMEIASTENNTDQNLVTDTDQPFSSGESGATEKAAFDSSESQKGEDVREIKPPAQPAIDASRFTFQLENKGTAILFQFFISRKKLDGKSLDGYIFLAFTGDNSDTLYPKTEFKDGAPTDPKQGIFFSIKQGKIIRGKAEQLNSIDQFRQVWALAYSPDGRLLMKEMLLERKK